MKESPSVKRITLGSIWTYILEILNFERGIFYTLKTLAFYPGKVIREFLLEDRTKLVKPLKLLIILVAISSLIGHYFMPSDAEMLVTIKAQLAQYNLPEDIATTFEKVQLLSDKHSNCLLYTSPSPRDSCASRMPSTA